MTDPTTIRGVKGPDRNRTDIVGTGTSERRQALSSRVHDALTRRILRAAAETGAEVTVRASMSGRPVEVHTGSECIISNEAAAVIAELERTGCLRSTGDSTYAVTVRGRRLAGISDA